MGIKWTLQGMGIYLMMALYVVTALAFFVRLRRVAWGLFAASFALGVAGLVYRGIHVEHLPMKSLFEVFLVLGTLMFPVSLLSRKVLGVGFEAGDALLGVIVLFPAGFVERFSEEASALMPAMQSALFGPHVAAYMAGYVALAKAAIVACAVLAVGRRPPADRSLVPFDIAMDRMVRVGFPFITIGLVLGCVWAKALQHWWNWDPKEMWSLATWCAFLAYFHLRAVARRRFVRLQAASVILGVLLIVGTLLFMNLMRIFKSYHTYATS